MFKSNVVFMGTLPKSWGENKRVKNITFSITDECNLRCTYCYFTHKNSKNVMSIDIAKKAVDDILTDPENNEFDGVIWEFIGGEPTLEMSLIDTISDYILYKMYALGHKWLYCYRFMIGTNGLLYGSKDFQRYVKKNKGNLSVAITIDGTKEKHDLSRRKKDGSGSYDEVMKVIPLWISQFGASSTKATFSHDDLPYLKDSIINLWKIGLKSVAANIVFEDVWKDTDVEIYKQQLIGLANYIIDNDLWDEYSVRFFDPIVGTPSTEEYMRRNICGTGIMMAINTNGDYYPCVRFMPSAMNKHSFAKLGSISDRINPDRLRPFTLLNTNNQSSELCLECDVAGGCGWCSGNNYDYSSIGTLYERKNYICKMHKANVEANKYLWREYELRKHKISPYRFKKLTTLTQYNKYLYIICDSNFPSFCEYDNDVCTAENENCETYMDVPMVNMVIRFCDENNYVPIFCGCKNLPDDYYGYQIVSYNDIVNSGYNLNDNYNAQILLRVEQIDQTTNLMNQRNVIVSAAASQIDQLTQGIETLINKVPQININISIRKIDVDSTQYLRDYNILLQKLFGIVISQWEIGNYITINNITNEIFANTIRPCGSGYNSLTISPEGKFYFCAGFYRLFPSLSIGDIDTGIDNRYREFCNPRKGPLCKDCEIRHCRRCILRNKCGTGEFHVPTELQCVISHMEYTYSQKLAEYLKKSGNRIPFEYNKNLSKIEHFDPVKKYVGELYPNNGLDCFVKKMNI